MMESPLARGATATDGRDEAKGSDVFHVNPFIETFPGETSPGNAAAACVQNRHAQTRTG
jgi:hypothetical protein